MVDWLPYAWYETAYWLVAAGMTFGFSLRTQGRRHVPRQGPALMIANHQSFLDPLLVGLAVRRHLYYLARKTLFRHRLFGAFLRSVNSVPVDQEGIGIEGLRTVAQQLQQGRAVLVFPEGERTPHGSMLPFRPGVLLLLKRAPAPVVPVGIAGAYEAWPRWQPMPRPAPLFLPGSGPSTAVSIGPPLDPRRLIRLPREIALRELFEAVGAAQQSAEQMRRKRCSARSDGDGRTP